MTTQTPTPTPTLQYCGLCDGDHETRDCSTTAVIQRSERFAEARTRTR